MIDNMKIKKVNDTKRVLIRNIIFSFSVFCVITFIRIITPPCLSNETKILLIIFGMLYIKYFLDPNW